MSRSVRADASICIPRMIPWRDWDEWFTVKALLFSADPSFRCRGVQHVAVWRSRERIPHAVETTSQLVEIRLNDVRPAGYGVALGQRSEEELRLIYSSIVIRAVNGLTGHEQKTAHATPVSSLARDIGLPTWLVDIRHEAAHKQLPGIVILRLAADFLVDYLWRRYWAPQTEHLGFLCGAFDQLISKYKATSENEASLHPDPSNSLSPLIKKRRAEPAVQSAGKRSKSKTASATMGAADTAEDAGGSGTHRAQAPGPNVAPRVLASEIAAQEIALSVTPTALPWALVSLLADGGVGGGGIDGSSGMAGRGQGHLLPRSRDRYPTPGTPGVSATHVGRRITSRWANLLNIFHSRWRGFGAALLVRLVEALLANASRDHAGAESGQSARPINGGSGMERQAAFIGLWVRHLLSRRWHLRVCDVTVREALQEAAVHSGLSAAFFEDDEIIWREEENAWADEPAPLAAIGAAYMPVREMLERCHRTLAALPVHSKNEIEHTEDDGAPAICTGVPARGAGEKHWAREGLEDVCRALGAVLGLQKGCLQVYAAGSSSCHEDTENGAQFSGAHRSSTSQRRKHERSENDQVMCPDKMTTGPASTSEKNGAEEESGREGDGAKAGQGNAESEGAVDGLGGGSAPTMLDLDALERLLGAERPMESRVPGPRETASVADMKLDPSFTAAAGKVHQKAEQKETGRDKDSRGVDEGAVAWEMVEDWTPCAIGTLPGWSGARLEFAF